MVRCPSVSLSLHGPRAANPLLWAQWAGDTSLIAVGAHAGSATLSAYVGS